MAMTENFSGFFETKDFAVIATLGGMSVTGIFDNDYAANDISGNMITSTPVFTLPSANVPANVLQLPLVLGSVTYKVIEPMSDGTGITVLRLRI